MRGVEAITRAQSGSWRLVVSVVIAVQSMVILLLLWQSPVAPPCLKGADQHTPSTLSVASVAPVTPAGPIILSQLVSAASANYLSRNYYSPSLAHPWRIVSMVGEKDHQKHSTIYNMLKKMGMLETSTREEGDSAGDGLEMYAFPPLANDGKSLTRLGYITKNISSELPTPQLVRIAAHGQLWERLLHGVDGTHDYYIVLEEDMKNANEVYLRNIHELVLNSLPADWQICFLPQPTSGARKLEASSLSLVKDGDTDEKAEYLGIGVQDIGEGVALL